MPILLLDLLAIAALFAGTIWLGGKAMAFAEALGAWARRRWWRQRRRALRAHYNSGRFRDAIDDAIDVEFEEVRR